MDDGYSHHRFQHATLECTGGFQSEHCELYIPRRDLSPILPEVVATEGETVAEYCAGRRGVSQVGVGERLNTDDHPVYDLLVRQRVWYRKRIVYVAYDVKVQAVLAMYGLRLLVVCLKLCRIV